MNYLWSQIFGGWQIIQAPVSKTYCLLESHVDSFFLLFNVLIDTYCLLLTGKEAGVAAKGPIKAGLQSLVR